MRRDSMYKTRAIGCWIGLESENYVRITYTCTFKFNESSKICLMCPHQIKVQQKNYINNNLLLHCNMSDSKIVRKNKNKKSVRVLKSLDKLHSMPL